MKITKSRRNNIIFLLIIALLIIPQTRKPIQVLLHKAIALVNPITAIEKTEQETITDYNWILKDENGKEFNFKSAKGKVTVVNFWATWCPPCIAEMPSLQNLFNKYENDVEFLFVTNDPIEKTEGFKELKNYTIPVYQIRSNPGAEQLVTSSIPRTLLIDKEGNIVIDKSGAVNWFSSKVQEQIDFLIAQ